jgi:SNF2 family DNA or RNA helicase
MAVKYAQDKSCPMCRNKLDISKLTIIIDANKDQTAKLEEETQQQELLPKLDTLLTFIKNNPNKKILVFSSYEKSFETLENEFLKKNITYSKLSGTAARINNIINKYKSGQVQVLLLNAKNFGAGLNLQITDEIIIYHRMSKDLERQVIGRAQRLGRSDPLKINYLCFENEYPTGYA